MVKFYKIFPFIYFLLAFGLSVGYSQSTCPSNLGFENGTLSNWQCYTGSVSKSGTTNVITLSNSVPIFNRHTLYNRTSNPGIDPFGKFPIICPDGGEYSVRLGNDGTGSQAERISYTLTVPINQPDFTITYYYAVVFQDPSHPAYQQPRFTAKVFDIADNKYISCASFEYIATSGLPGFKQATTGVSVFYKDWSPVTINLSDYAGKQIKLEFSTADCTETGHFGYAYIDISDNCSSAITGNNYCGFPSSITLKGPGGYDKYNWYNSDFSKLLGTGKSFVLSPAPANNTKLSLQVIPYQNFGCLDTLFTVIKATTFNYQVHNPASVCSGNLVNLTSNVITSGSELGLIFSYWKDPNGTIPLTNPSSVAISGTYYIKAVKDGLCNEIKPVIVEIYSTLLLKITDPSTTCLPILQNITSKSITSGSDPNLNLTYWNDANATIPLVNPEAIAHSGIFYIKAVNDKGCSSIKPVKVTLNPLINLLINEPGAVCYGASINLTLPALTKGSDTDLNLSYWKDENATNQLLNPDSITTKGVYYIKATNKLGCSIIKSVNVIINPLPQLIINNPNEVCTPFTVDITVPEITTGSIAGLAFSYWEDFQATKILKNTSRISLSGTYYIKAVNQFGCEKILPVKVIINPLPVFTTKNPRPVYESNTVDITSLVSSKSNELVYTHWNFPNSRGKISDPKNISLTGVYYITGTNIHGCSISLPVNVQVFPKPQVFVPTAFTPLQQNNNRLFPFFIGVKQLFGFKIYNKWGNLVYQTNDLKLGGWDGYYQSNLHFFDTYTWYVDGIDELDNYFKKSGNSILIR